MILRYRMIHGYRMIHRCGMILRYRMIHRCGMILRYRMIHRCGMIHGCGMRSPGDEESGCRRDGNHLPGSRFSVFYGSWEAPLTA